MKNKTKNIKKRAKDLLVTALIIALCFGFCLAIQYFVEEDNALIPAIFVLGVFLTSVITDGYIFGVTAALISVLAVNFAFTFPFFAFDFTVPENLISTAILLIVTIITCGLTTKVKRWESIKAESEKERMRANLLRAVSHDLRTPLTTIYGASTVIFEKFDDLSRDSLKRMVGGIVEDSEWLIRMVENLLSVTRLDGANVEIIKSNTPIDELIDSVLVKFSKRYPDISVNVDIPDEFICIPMDPLLIEQVIINILENSAQHAKGMTALALKVSILSDKAIFEIKDNGCGIPEEKIKNIFSGCYLNVSEKSDSKKNHSGIGVSVCASIVKAHGGSIKAKNLKEGGCVFCFALATEENENA